MAEKKGKQYVIDNPQLMEEWNWAKNSELGISPQTISVGTNLKTWWKCQKAHEWQATVSNRSKGRGCPFCAGNKTLKGYNDLQTVNPTLAKEWNQNRNGLLKPDGITANSGKKVWWKCQEGHEWTATVYNRNNGRGCPFCSGKKLIIGQNDLKTTNPSLAKEWNFGENREMLPEDFTAYSRQKVWWKCDSGHTWPSTIANRVLGNGCPYCAGKKAVKGKTDLHTVNPSLAGEWNYEKNGIHKPENFTANSHKEVWWKCRNGHEWKASIKNRNNGRGCPYCSGRYAITGKNDLQTVNPLLASEWFYEKNKSTPENVMPNSNKKVWWKCSKGHVWKAVVASRNIGGGCPYCSGKRAIKGETDLQTVNPSLADEWNYEKNGNLKPDAFTGYSNLRVWWKCSKGHEWKAIIGSRNKGTGCPICSSEQTTSFPEYALIYYLRKSGVDVIHSFKKNGYELDIYIPSKNIAIEYDGYYWHKEKREVDLEKNQKCKKDGIILYRVREGLPSLNDYSIDFIVQRYSRDLATAIDTLLYEITGSKLNIDLKRDAVNIENLREHLNKKTSFLFSNPELAQEWNYEKNGNLKPEHFMPNSGKKVWWKCGKGHEWQTRICNRNKGSGCPFCSGKKVLMGYNDLQTNNPNVAKDWDHEKNSGLSPADVTTNSNKKVWWKCQRGHEWQATIYQRNKGSGCPYCARKRTKRKEQAQD